MAQHRPFLLERPLGLCLCILWCWLLLLEFDPPLRHEPIGLSLTFNSMMDHMLQGRFDVDPVIVEKEGFLRDGRVYAYWGIFCALLRLPLMLLRDGVHWDMTRLSCMIAVAAMLIVNRASVRQVAARVPEADWLVRGLHVALAFSGVQICFLEPTLYQEVCLWAGVFALWFVHWALRACLDPAQIGRALPIMALAAGLALITRVSTGIGLHAALGLFMLLILWRERRGALPWRALIMAGAILALFLAITAAINQLRWGNPLTFADYRFYIMNADYPDRVTRMHADGLFSPARIGLGLVYFLLPVWVVTGPDGRLLLDGPFRAMLDAAELPPSSFLLTDAWLCLLFALFLAGLLRRRAIGDRAGAGLIAAGLSIAALLMLMAVSMNYRYRIEFYPLLVFGALLGAVALGRAPVAGQARWRRLASPLLWTSIVSSHLVLGLYKLSDLGPAHLRHLSHGLIAYYREMMHL